LSQSSSEPLTLKELKEVGKYLVEVQYRRSVIEKVYKPSLEQCELTIRGYEYKEVAYDSLITEYKEINEYLTEVIDEVSPAWYDNFLFGFIGGIIVAVALAVLL
jgi:hypothetical protein